MLNLDPNETIVLEVHRHWYVLMPRMCLVFFLAIAPAIFSSVLSATTPVHISELLFSSSTFIYMLWLLLLWISFFITWTNYYLDVWFVTEKRIISIDQVSIFHRRISNLRFDKIQDVSIEMKGVMQTMLKFGDIHIRTAGDASENFFFKNAENPDDVRRIIFEHHADALDNTRSSTVRTE